jgi:hypothetical protein
MRVEIGTENNFQTEARKNRYSTERLGNCITNSERSGKFLSTLLFSSAIFLNVPLLCFILFNCPTHAKIMMDSIAQYKLIQPNAQIIHSYTTMVFDYNGIINSKIPRCHFLSHFRAMLTLISKSLVLYFQHKFVLQAKIDKILLFSFEFSSCLYHHSSEKAHQLKVWVVASRKSLYRSSLPFSLFHDSA